MWKKSNKYFEYRKTIPVYLLGDKISLTTDFVKNLFDKNFKVIVKKIDDIHQMDPLYFGNECILIKSTDESDQSLKFKEKGYSAVKVPNEYLGLKSTYEIQHINYSPALADHISSLEIFSLRQFEKYKTPPDNVAKIYIANFEKSLDKDVKKAIVNAKERGKKPVPYLPVRKYTENEARSLLNYFKTQNIDEVVILAGGNFPGAGEMLVVNNQTGKFPQWLEELKINDAYPEWMKVTTEGEAIRSDTGELPHWLGISSTGILEDKRFNNTSEFLKCINLNEYGIKEIGIAGHPEYSKFMNQAECMNSLLEKEKIITQRGMSMYIITQVIANPHKFVTWQKAVRQQGIQSKIYIGLLVPDAEAYHGRFYKICEALTRNPDKSEYDPEGIYRVDNALNTPEKVWEFLLLSGVQVDNIHLYTVSVPPEQTKINGITSVAVNNNSIDQIDFEELRVKHKKMAKFAFKAPWFKESLHNNVKTSVDDLQFQSTQELKRTHVFFRSVKTRYAADDVCANDRMRIKL
ncbi:hypothetical protein Lsan_2705 [Legionella santicrucis]|uniref:Uncharacterized protein n=1 Tax=Legionella santicrucis TaxID=45074 RepID=A0A0W0YHV6_9GAMM|nr:methylenetetrahydrofolate reductase [Legionella santicrucis]KTD56545.1 hypothetical protein Lsan_2705 [Legionella santicrucis]